MSKKVLGIFVSIFGIFMFLTGYLTGWIAYGNYGDDDEEKPVRKYHGLKFATLKRDVEAD